MPESIIDQDVINDLSPYYDSLNSVSYRFTYPQDYNHNAVGWGIHFVDYADYTNFSADGCYYVVAEKNSVFNTQIAYIHNKTNTTIIAVFLHERSIFTNCNETLCITNSKNT